MSRIAALVESRTLNAAVAWGLVALLAIVAAASAAAGDYLWTVYAAAVVAVALIPAAVTGEGAVLVSWEVLALAALPVLAQRFGVVSEPLTYLSVAALALLVAVEIEVFSSAEMPSWFAVLFVVLTTLAAAGVWGILQYVSDVTLGTTFVPGQTELMWDLVAATAFGVGAGVAFELYFRETDSASARGETIT